VGRVSVGEIDGWRLAAMVNKKVLRKFFLEVSVPDENLKERVTKKR
jgi:hypothetical protein